MKWNETIASKCRYGEIAGEIWGEAEIIWENSLDNYQGYAVFLAAMPDGSFSYYEWSYGSCSGCDEWEAADYSDEEIERLMRNNAAWLKDAEVTKRFFHLEGEFKDAKVPTANSTTNGSIPGMMRYMFGGIGNDFNNAAKALEDYLNGTSI